MSHRFKSFLMRARHTRVRNKVIGTVLRPRMSVKFSGKNIYVQFIDDNLGNTLASASSLKNRLAGVFKSTNIDNSRIIGKEAAEAAIAVGIRNIVFDRGSKLYHGRVKALADAAREAGLKF